MKKQTIALNNGLYFELHTDESFWYLMKEYSAYDPINGRSLFSCGERNVKLTNKHNKLNT